MAGGILIVDDHPTFRDFARRLLEAGGWVVAGEAADGASALAEVEALRPDVVLLDVQLPDIDGFEVCRRLAGGERPPVVVLTSGRDPGDYGARVDGCGARGFIAKADLSATAVAALVGEAA